MSYSVGDVRRWESGALTSAGSAVASRMAVVGDAGGALSDGAERLYVGWVGLAADSVLAAAESEKSHVTKLGAGLEDLADALWRAHEALAPAVQAVRDRITEAEKVALVIDGRSVRPGPEGGDIDQGVVDLHAEAISNAVETVRSLDEHYGREVDEIAGRLRTAIPPEVDRSPIPGPDDPWPGRAVDAMTRAMSWGFPGLADELDPESRGRHKLNPAPDDFGSAAGKGLRGLGRFAGPLGSGLTVYDGVDAYAKGETSVGEAAAETGGALGGGALGGFAAGAAAGSFLGPVGAILGAGIGAAVGTYLGQQTGSVAYDAYDAIGNGTTVSEEVA